MWKTRLFQTSLADYLCTGVLLISIANVIVFFSFMYNAMNKNVTKNNMFILNLSILLTKLCLKYAIKVLQWHGYGPCSWGTKPTTVNMGIKFCHPCTRTMHAASVNRPLDKTWPHPKNNDLYRLDDLTWQNLTSPNVYFRSQWQKSAMFYFVPVLVWNQHQLMTGKFW